MSVTTIPTMIVMDVETRAPLRTVFLGDLIDCDHLWEPHPDDLDKALCARCASVARWSKNLECDHLWARPRMEDMSAYYCARCRTSLQCVNGVWS